jgi:uncharacterized protein
MGIREKERKLRRTIERYGRIAVAFSGGADSSLLLRTAVEVLGPGNVAAFTSRSCLLKDDEIEKVASWFPRQDLSAAEFHRFIDIDPLDWDEFVENPRDRCYHCKSRVYGLFLRQAGDMGFPFLADGTNADDLQSDRPGLRALRELGIATPLAAAGLGKGEVRELSRLAGLDTWDRPSASCLATRVPSGLSITGERLDLVSRAEKVLENSGFTGCRVRLDRCDAAAACIEVQRKDIPRITGERCRRHILAEMGKLGFSRVLLDIYGREG